MTFTKTLAAATAVALASTTAASAGTYAAPTVEAVPVVIVEEASSSSLGGVSWPLIIAIMVGVGFMVASSTTP